LAGSRELGKKQIQKERKGNVLRFYFVPKPHTPFQWCAQEDIDSIKRSSEVEGARPPLRST